MNKEEFVELLNAEKLSLEDLTNIDQLIKEYPWFGLPKFLRLKALRQNDREPNVKELNAVVIHSSDRKHLYNWINGNIDFVTELQRPNTSEIEFLENDDELEENSISSDPFELIDEVLSTDLDEAEVKTILEKEESEMEDPEIDEINAMPVIGHFEMEDEADLDEEPVKSDEENLEEQSPELIAEVQTPKGVLKDSKPSSGISRTNQSAELIENFLHNEPGIIKADKETKLEGDVSKGSVEEDDSFITDTLAKIYVKQGLHAKAIYAYERLSLKYPEKSAYFAAQIEKIKIILNV